MFEELAETRRGIVSFWRSLFDNRCNLPVVSVTRRSEPLPGESMEQRRARIQATMMRCLRSHTPKNSVSGFGMRQVIRSPNPCMPTEPDDPSSHWKWTYAMKPI